MPDRPIEGTSPRVASRLCRTCGKALHRSIIERGGWYHELCRPKRKPMPKHVREKLIRDVVMDDRGFGPKPKRWHCPRCHAEIIVAWRDGLFETIAVDPIALTPKGEYEALRAGRRTFENWRDGLDERTPRSIARRPAGTDRFTPVRPEHECWAPVPENTN